MHREEKSIHNSVPEECFEGTVRGAGVNFGSCLLHRNYSIGSSAFKTCNYPYDSDYDEYAKTRSSDAMQPRHTIFGVLCIDSLSIYDACQALDVSMDPC